MLKPRDFKGTNYVPCTALGLVSPFGMLSDPGTYWRPWVEQELRLLRSVGFNSVRLQGATFLGWAINRGQFMANLEHMATVCAEQGLAITWQFWSSTDNNIGSIVPGAFHGLWMHPLSLVDGILLLLRTYPSSPYPPNELGDYSLFPEPSLHVVADWQASTNWQSSKGDLRAKMREYVGEIAQFFGQNPIGNAAFGSYDLFNEPDKPGYDALSIPLILDTYKEVVRYHQGAEFTVGLAGPERDNTLLEAYKNALAAIQTYWSFHIDLDRVQRQITVIRSLSGPKVASEFWHTLPGHDQSGRMWVLLQHVLSQGWGGQMWGFLRTNAFRVAVGPALVPIDGILKPIRPASLQMPIDFEIQHARDFDALRAWFFPPWSFQ